MTDGTREDERKGIEQARALAERLGRMAPHSVSPYRRRLSRPMASVKAWVRAYSARCPSGNGLRHLSRRMPGSVVAMAPETEELIEKLKQEEERIRELLDETAASEPLSRDEDADAHADDEDLKTLQKAGLLPA